MTYLLNPLLVCHTYSGYKISLMASEMQCSPYSVPVVVSLSILSPLLFDTLVSVYQVFSFQVVSTSPIMSSSLLSTCPRYFSPLSFYLHVMSPMPVLSANPLLPPSLHESSPGIHLPKFLSPIYLLVVPALFGRMLVVLNLTLHFQGFDPCWCSVWSW